MKTKNMLAMFMAGIMLMTIFGAMSVSATDSGEQDQQSLSTSPTPILANVKFFVYEKSGFLGKEKIPIGGAKVTIFAYIQNQDLIPYIRIFFTHAFGEEKGYTNWIEVFPYIYLYKVKKDGYNSKLGAFFVLPGKEKIISVCLDPIEGDSSIINAASSPSSYNIALPDGTSIQVPAALMG